MAETQSRTSTLDANERTVRIMTPRWAWLVGTVCGIGHLRPGPGTCGSLAAVLTWWLVASFIPASNQPWIAVAVVAVVTLIGIPAATLVARGAGAKDPSKVVVDEVAGQMVALIAVPLDWKALLASFILFRAFDILKPPPVRQLERLPEGSGIVVDDLAAGAYALMVMQLLLRFGILG